MITDAEIEDEIPEILNSLVERSRAKLLGARQEQLEEYWYFRFNQEDTDEYNLYRFARDLEAYRRNCREWEEHHNGHICVVERVRDQYLMPKIAEFICEIRARG